MITLVIFVSVFAFYVAVIFIRGIYHEKKDRKQKKYEDPLKEDEPH
ncbi:MAG: hypothetical protein ABIE03_01840 [Patescibacteria group bacterium]